jgi:hypothetical protein
LTGETVVVDGPQKSISLNLFFLDLADPLLYPGVEIVVLAEPIEESAVPAFFF